MKILLVISDYYSDNAFSGPVRAIAEQMKEMGAEVRVLSSNAGGTPDYELDFNKVLKISCGRGVEEYHLAVPDQKVIGEALEWAQFVHVEDPSKLCQVTARMASEKGLPVTGSFRLFPESIHGLMYTGRALSAVHMEQYRDYTYSYCRAIRCPSELVYRRLQKFDYEADLYVIEGGVNMDVIVESMMPFSYEEKYVADPTPLAQAFAGGDVPVIEEHEYSAASYYALAPQNRFENGDKPGEKRCLAYWKRHPGELEGISLLYRQKAQSLSARNAAQGILTMMRNVYEDYFMDR